MLCLACTKGLSSRAVKCVQNFNLESSMNYRIYRAYWQLCTLFHSTTVNNSTLFW